MNIRLRTLSTLVPPAGLALGLALLASGVIGSGLVGPVPLGAAGADPTTTTAAAQAPATPQCPTFNAPNSMTLAGGSPQTAKTGTPFASPFAVQFINTNGCPVTSDAAGIAVTFTAPLGGPSGSFDTTGTTTATVGTTASGQATAPPFTADGTPGSYTVVASAQNFGTIDFSLTNTTTDVAATITAAGGTPQSAVVGSAFASPLTATVVDAGGDPVSGAQVTFTVSSDNGAGATFASGGPTAMAVTDATGTATSPVLTAGDTSGGFSATATTSGVDDTATFSLTDLAAAPYAITSGVGASQSAPAGSQFPIPLAVTVTDKDKNPVPGAAVTFAAPASGPSGAFAGGGVVATTTTDVDGIAVAPAFTAGGTPGGYIVTAAVAGVNPPASFALVNQPGAPSSGGTAPAPPAVGMVRTPDGGGYWLVAADGGVFAFGDARFLGSAGGTRLAAPVVGMTVTPDGGGYWLVAADGGVFSFGDARFLGSAR
jgi:hypothetical protein